MAFSSQYGEDEFLVSRGLVPGRGTFIDVGAGDPIRFSNTHYFERSGWTGVCIDADPTQVEALKRIRRAAVEWAVVGEAQGEVELFAADDPDYSSTLNHLRDFAAEKGWSLRTLRVPVQPLNAILQKHAIQSIDLLSIDTEGTELDVCRGLDWRRYRPNVVVIEYATAAQPSQELSIRAYFASLPYRLVHRTPSNLIFKRSRLPRGVRLLLARRQVSG